jgi:hypothetical protein
MLALLASGWASLVWSGLACLGPLGLLGPRFFDTARGHSGDSVDQCESATEYRAIGLSDDSLALS